jgi:hypothetical protein
MPHDQKDAGFFRRVFVPKIVMNPHVIEFYPKVGHYFGKSHLSAVWVKTTPSYPE